MAGFTNTFILCLITQPVMAAIGQDVTFYIFGVISLLGALWCYRYLKETSTCATDKEKKALYIPADLRPEAEIDLKDALVEPTIE